MQWYFVENGQKNGPHEESAFGELIGSGTVGPKTLVWCAGMENWQPLEEVRPPQTPAAPPVAAFPAAAEMEPAPDSFSPAAQAAARPASTPAATPAAARAIAATARCGVCGAEHGSEELMRFRDTLVCAACKPAYVQRLREGTAQPGQYRYAGFWIRFAAKFIDGIILGIFSIVITALTGLTMAGLIAGGGDEPALGMLMAVQGVNILLQTAVQCAFVTFFISRYAATPGKMATGLVVIRADGSALTTGRAFGRYFGEWLSGITLGIGYIMAGFDEEKRALHDRVCDTRVVFKASRA